MDITPPNGADLSRPDEIARFGLGSQSCWYVIKDGNRLPEQSLRADRS
jgi:hypothetical protein